MTDREKLVDMIVHYCDRVGYPDCKENCTLCLADYMIANGVTFKEECYNCGIATQEVIAKLQSDIANLRKSQTWISVEERLPEWCQVVLCKLRRRELPVICQWDDLCGVWIERRITRSHDKAEVTHWMPLPEPPKEE